jgi:hypothetical protein
MGAPDSPLAGTLGHRMRLVMTLLVRNEADIIDANVDFHLNAGVDFIVATDTGSEDGSSDILGSYEREGVLHLVRERSPFSQIEVVTGMARLAATRFSADWIINNDADEFWWPRSGTLKEVLATVPPRFGSVRGMWRHFVARPFGEDFFAERMTIRICAPVTHEDHAFSPHFKTAHRADPDVRVGGGNHEVYGDQLLPLVGWYPFDVLHFPIRSLEQCERKYRQWRALDAVGRRSPDPRRATAYAAFDEGRSVEFYESHLVGDDVLERGLQEGTLAVDTRLRDALRSLRPTFASVNHDVASPVRDEPRLRFATAERDEHYLSELGALEDASARSRTERRVESLEHRLAALENGPLRQTWTSLVGSVALDRRSRARRTAHPRPILVQGTRLVGAALALVMAFAGAVAIVEATTDRDWTLSGLEWPEDVVTAAGLCCLVLLVYYAVAALLHLRGRASPVASTHDDPA